MQYWQPMQSSLLMSTILVFSSRYDAPVGHTCTHGASAHCWHMLGIQCILRWGNSPSGPLRMTLFQYCPRATPFSCLQATSQLKHPVHRFESITMA